MQRYFVSHDDFLKGIITKDFHHIKNVMRMKPDDKITIVDEKKAYLSSIVSIDDGFISFKVIEELSMNTEFPFTIDIVQGFAKGDKMDAIVQKATELGASGIYPAFMKRSIVKLDEAKSFIKRERFAKIAKEASEQSKRTVIPEIYPITSLNKIDFSSYNVKMIAYEEAAKQNDLSTFKQIIEKISYNDKVVIVIGPEGGIDLEEITYLENQGFQRVGLGPRILRTETASSYILSALSFSKELKI